MTRVILAAILLCAVTAYVSAAPTTINVTMTGEKEPSGGSLGGVGNGSYTFDPDADTISWLLNYSNINGTSLTGFHIHGPNAIPTANSPIYRGFTITPGQAPPSGTLSGTLTLADDPDLGNKIDLILSNPNGFYVNLHTSASPGGAIRSTLPEPGTISLLICGVLGLSIRRKRA